MKTPPPSEPGFTKALASPPLGRPPLGGIVWDIALNTVFPFLLYKASLRWISPSEFTALVVASLFPIGKSAFDLARHRGLDPVSMLVLLGIVTDAVAMLLGGSPRLLLLRESLFTGLFGVACFISLFLPRPMMYYFGRYFIAGDDPVRRARYAESWRLPFVRRGHRWVTVLWGTVYAGELGVRTILIYTLSPGAVLIVSPLLMGALTIFAIVWTFGYAFRMRRRVVAAYEASPSEKLSA